MFYETVFCELEKGKVRYLLVGGVAVNLYGVPRVTADIDIILDLSKENIEKFISVMQKLGYRPRAPIKAIEFADPLKRKEWQEKKNMRVFSFFNSVKSFEEIDVFIKEPIDFEAAYTCKNIMEVEEIKIPVVSIDDLIKLKKMACRKQDISDIEALKQVKRIYEKRK